MSEMGERQGQSSAGWLVESTLILWQASASDSALFKELSTLWRLSSPSSSPLSHSHSPPDLPSTAIDPSASSTLVSLDLAFAFRNPLHAVVGETVFRKMAERMVDAFERRMAQVHSR